MPRLELEITDNLVEIPLLPQILEKLVSTFSTCETVDPAAVKCYVDIHEIYQTGEGAKPGFIHLTLCLLTGRSIELQKKMSEQMAQQLNVLFSSSRNQGLAGITVEMREMTKETFTKLD